MGSIANMVPVVSDLNNDEESCTYAIQLFSSIVLPMTLKAAIKLDLLEIISRAGPGAYLSPDEVAAKLQTTNPEAPVMLDRILRFLASYNIFKCIVSADNEGHLTRRYAAAPVCKFLTKNDYGVSLGTTTIMGLDKVFMKSWDYLDSSVLEGGNPFTRAHGMNLYEYLGTDERFSTVFNEGMRSHSTIIMKKILENYKGFSDVKVLVDVGGGIGASLNMIVSKHPHLKGINYDLPFVTAQAPTFAGIEHVSGDMFSSVPSGDAILMKWILHNWSDENCLKILMNCWRALPENGKVIVLENVLPVAPEATVAAQSVFHFDVIMLSTFHGGKVRSEMELQILGKEAGFSAFKVLFSYANCWVIELSK